MLNILALKKKMSLKADVWDLYLDDVLLLRHLFNFLVKDDEAPVDPWQKYVEEVLLPDDLLVSMEPGDNFAYSSRLYAQEEMDNISFFEENKQIIEYRRLLLELQSNPCDESVLDVCAFLLHLKCPEL